MSAAVHWLSGEDVQVTTQPGAPAAELRAELSKQLDLYAGCLELVRGDKLLTDDEEVPADDVLVVIRDSFWLDDGSDSIQDLGGGQFIVKGDPQRFDTKLNALCDIGFSAGLNYFSVEVLQGKSASVGVATKDAFRMGSSLRFDDSDDDDSPFGQNGIWLLCCRQLAEKGDVLVFEVNLLSSNIFSTEVWHNGKCVASSQSMQVDVVTVFPVVGDCTLGDHFRITFRQNIQRLEPNPIITMAFGDIKH